MTELECREILKLIGAAYPTQRQRMSNDDVRAMAAAYTAGMMDLDFARVRESVGRLVKSSRFMPTIFEIREAVVDVTYGRRSPGGDAWGRCLSMVRRYGSHRRPGIDFPVDDPLLLAAIRALGWMDICHSEHAHADRARFVELYDQLSTDARKEAAIAPNVISNALPSPQRTEAPLAMRELVCGLIPEKEVQ